MASDKDYDDGQEIVPCTCLPECPSLCFGLECLCRACEKTGPVKQIRRLAQTLELGGYKVKVDA